MANENEGSPLGWQMGSAQGWPMRALLRDDQWGFAQGGQGGLCSGVSKVGPVQGWPMRALLRGGQGGLGWALLRDSQRALLRGGGTARGWPIRPRFII